MTHENRPPLGNDMYGAFGRDFATTDGRRVMVVAISLNQWQSLVRRDRASTSTCPRSSSAFGADFTHEGRPLPRPRRDRRADRAVVRSAHARRDAHRVRRARRVLGPVPDVHAAARRGLAGVGRQPGVRRRRPARHRASLRTPASPLRSRPIRRVPPLDGAAARHAHRRGPRPRCWACRAPRSGGCTTTGWSRAPASDRVTEPTPRRRRLRAAASGPRRPRARRALAATLDADPRARSTAGELPIPWHWTCFLPDAPTAALGADGHPRRRAEMAAFPRRMWVGGAVTSPSGAPGPPGRACERVASARSRRPVRPGASGSSRWSTRSRRTACPASPSTRTSCSASRRRADPARPDDAPAPDWVEARTAEPALLFRYSALTFNAHRIHYDRPYATGVEGYPDLVVQGPLTATLLCELARVGSVPCRFAGSSSALGRRCSPTGASG